MTSTTSSNNLLHELKQMYGWTLKKRMGLVILFCGLHFLTMPLIEILALNSAQRTNILSGYQVDMNMRFLNVLYVTLPVLTVSLSLLLALISSVLLYSYMHQKRSVDLFHALPVSRNALMASSLLNGLTMLIIPLVLNFTLTAAVGAYYKLDMSTHLPFLAESFGWILFLSVAAFLFCTVMAVCSGTTFDMVISTVVVNITYPLLIVLGNLTAGLMVPGMTSDIFTNTTFITALSPFSAAYLPIIGNSMEDDSFIGLSFLVWWAVFLLVAAVIAFVLYRYRQSECAESNYAFPIPKIVIRFVATGASGLAFGLIFLSFLDTTSGFFIGLIAGSLAAHVVAEAVYSRGFKGLKRSFAYYGIFLLAFTGFYGICATGALGYDTRLPKAEEVSSVEANLNVYSYYNNNGFTVFDENNRNVIASVGKQLKDPQTIQKVLELHKELIDLNRTYAYPYQVSTNNSSQDIRLTYTLKNGTTVQRYYSTSVVNQRSEAIQNDFRQKTAAIMATKEYKTAGNPYFYLTPQFIQSLSLQIEGEEQEVVIVPDRQKMQELIDALQEDWKNYDYSELLNEYKSINGSKGSNTMVWLNFNMQAALPSEGSLLKEAVGSYSNKVQFHVNGLYPNEQFPNTRKVILENGWISEEQLNATSGDVRQTGGRTTAERAVETPEAVETTLSVAH